MDNWTRHSSTKPTTTLPSKQSASDVHAQRPWTATRCHRLLRPLLAHVASLRKERSQRGLASGLGGDARSAAGKRGSQDEAPWGPGRKKRKIGNTYSSKASRSAVSIEEPYTPKRTQAPPQQRIASNRLTQPIVMPTPFLRRVRNHEMSSPIPAVDQVDVLAPAEEAPAVHPRGNPHSADSVGLSQLRGTLDQDRLRLQEAVFHALLVLLVATCPKKTVVAEPKSLMAMCLRQVPECIAEFEWWEQKEASENGTKSTMNDSQISMEIYSDLENLGATDGWRHLCLVVRAHGVRIVREAVREGLFDDAVAELLIKLCVKHLPLDECEGLVDSFIFRQYPARTTAHASLSEPKAMRPLAILSSLDRANSHFRMRKMGELLASGMLPSNWVLADEFSAMWTSAVRLLAKSSSSYQDVVGFMAIMLEQLCRLESAQRQPHASEGDTVVPGESPGQARKVLIAAVAAVASVVLLRKEREEPTEVAEEKTAVLAKRVRYLLETCISNIRQQRTARKRRVSTYVLSLCAFLALDDGDATEAIEAAWQRGRHPQSENPAFLYDITVALVGSVAHLLGRGSPLPTNRSLSQLCGKLHALDLADNPLSSLHVDSAFVRAELSGNLRDLAYAEHLQVKSAKQAQNDKCKLGRGNERGQENKSAHAGFRWDDDIGEWVIAGSGSQPAVKPANSDFRRSTRISSSRSYQPTHVAHLAPRSPPSSASPSSQGDDGLSDAQSEASGVSDCDEEEDEEPAARSPPTTETSPASSSSPPPQTPHSKSPRRPRRSIVNPPDSDNSDSEFVDDSSPPPQPRHVLTQRPARSSVRPRRTSQQPSVDSSEEDDDELGQDAGSGRRLPRGRVAAVRKQGVVRSRSVSMLSLVPDLGPESSEDELSFV